MEKYAGSNVVSFQKKMADHSHLLRERALYGINSQELSSYYNHIVKQNIQHLSLLQKFLAEEFLGDIVIESFTMGISASKLCLDGKSPEDIGDIYDSDVRHKLSSVMSKHQLDQFFREGDLSSLNLMAEELLEKWFLKGIQYGEKQRKLRLM